MVDLNGIYCLELIKFDVFNRPTSFMYCRSRKWCTVERCRTVMENDPWRSWISHGKLLFFCGRWVLCRYTTRRRRSDSAIMIGHPTFSLRHLNSTAVTQIATCSRHDLTWTRSFAESVSCRVKFYTTPYRTTTAQIKPYSKIWRERAGCTPCRACCWFSNLLHSWLSWICCTVKVK